MRDLSDLGVLESTRRVVDRARSVSIDELAVDRLGDRLVNGATAAPEWRVWPHWWDGSERTANYALVLDALNFSFWGEPKWRVHYGGKTLDGYWALAACLHRALAAGVPILDAGFLSGFDEAEARRLFAGEGEIPMLRERVDSLREVGSGLGRWGGSFARLVEQAKGSAVTLVKTVVDQFASFDDVAQYDGEPVRFYKRAQILMADLHGAFAGDGLGRFEDLDCLTAFADYKVPQVLRELGVLVYEPHLAERVDRRVLIDAGEPAEVEIRAATIWACEHLKRRLNARRAKLGERGLHAFEVDWRLWDLAQGLECRHPYHRTRTIYY